MAIQVELTDTFEQWRVKTNQISVTADGFESNIAILQGNISQLESNVTLIKSNLTAVYANISSINSNVTSIRSNLTAVYANISSINSNVTSIRSNLTAVYANINSINSNVTAVNSNLTAVYANINSINSNVTAVIANVSNLQNAVVVTTNAGGGNVDLGNVSATRIRITNTGAVGIGTSNPRGNLEVDGSLVIGNVTSTAFVTLNAPTGAGQTYYLPSSDGTAGNVLTTNGAGVMSWQAPVSNTVALIYVVDSGSSALTTGIKGDLQVPFAATITTWSLMADASGTAQVDIWRDTFANFPPTIADTITSAGTKPRLNSQAANTGVATGWTTSIPANSVIRYNIDSTATIKRLTITLTCNKI